MQILPREGLSGHMASGEAGSIEADSSLQPIKAVYMTTRQFLLLTTQEDLKEREILGMSS